MHKLNIFISEPFETGFVKVYTLSGFYLSKSRLESGLKFPHLLLLFFPSLRIQAELGRQTVCGAFCSKTALSVIAILLTPLVTPPSILYHCPSGIGIESPCLRCTCDFVCDSGKAALQNGAVSGQTVLLDHGTETAVNGPLITSDGEVAAAVTDEHALVRTVVC